MYPWPWQCDFAAPSIKRGSLSSHTLSTGCLGDVLCPKECGGGDPAPGLSVDPGSLAYSLSLATLSLTCEQAQARLLGDEGPGGAEPTCTSCDNPRAAYSKLVLRHESWPGLRSHHREQDHLADPKTQITKITYGFSSLSF